MQNACTQPTEQEVIDIIARLYLYKIHLSEDFILAAVMKEFKGKANPAAVRRTIKKIYSS